MSKEYTLDRIADADPQPVVPAADLEEAANGNASSSTDAMGSSGSANESEAEADATPTISDRTENSWSESVGGQNYNYGRYGYSLSSNTVRINPQTGNAVDNADEKDGLENHSGELRGTVNGNDPEKGLYHRDKYKINSSVALEDDNSHPAFTDLVTQSDAGREIVALQGTLQSPNVSNFLDKSSLFIDGQTHQEDIQQGNVGDCYFLAALLQVIHYDPQKIVGMMSLAGDDVSTTFYYREGTGENATWKPTVIKTKLGILARDNVYESNPTGMYYMGSRVRLNYSPKQSIWSPSIQYSSEYEGWMLKIDKKRYFEAALWVNCMEQAFSLYARNYGQYGEGLDGENNQERFAAINGGWSGQCLHMFYGNDASESKRVENGDAGSNVLVAGREMIADLLMLAKAQNGDSELDVHIMAATLRGDAIRRYNAFAKKLKNELRSARIKKWFDFSASSEEKAQLKEAYQDVDRMVELGKAYAKNPSGQYREGESSAAVTDIREELNTLSIKLEKNEAFQNLNLDIYPTFQQATGMIVEFTATQDDPAHANIYIYNNHAYNVDRVYFRDKNNKSLNDADLNTLLASVDVDKSYLYLQNPHGKTTPNYHEEQKTNKNNGEFKTTLEAFLNNIQTLTVVTTKNNRGNE